MQFLLLSSHFQMNHVSLNLKWYKLLFKLLVSLFRIYNKKLKPTLFHHWSLVYSSNYHIRVISTKEQHFSANFRGFFKRLLLCVCVKAIFSKKVRENFTKEVESEGILLFIYLLSALIFELCYFKDTLLYFVSQNI